MTAIKGVLFDMDNTLIDWSGFTNDWRDLDQMHLQRVYDFLEQANRKLNSDIDEFVAIYIDKVTDAWAQARTTLRAPHMGRLLLEAAEACGFQADDVIDMQALLQAFKWNLVENVTLFPDVPQGLKNLQARGLKLGIVTNAFQPMRLRDAELETIDILQYFPNESARIAAADVGYLKPHEIIFRHALAQLGTSAEETVFVGDNPVADIAGAQGAGMRAVLRVNHPAPPLISGLIIPDGAVNDFGELVQLIDRWAKEAAE